jgi:hypothetical protein
MKIWKWVLGSVAALGIGAAVADTNYTQGDGVTRNAVLFDFTCFTTKHCTAHVPINSSGAVIHTDGTDTAYAGSGTTTQFGFLKGLYNIMTSAPTLGSATGGWVKKRMSALSTTVTAVKSSAAGQLGMLHCSNGGASTAFVQVFDVATAGAVTLGTTVPDLSFEIPPGISSGYSLPLVGMQFSAGIQVAATTTATGSSAPSTTLNCNAAYN